MATFYSSPAGKRDIMPTLYLKEQQHRNSNSSVTGSGSMLYLHYPSSGTYLDMLGGIDDAQHDCINLPATTTMMSQDSSLVEPGSIAAHIVYPGFNGVKDGRNEMMFFQTVGGSMSSGADLIHNSITDDRQMALQTPVCSLDLQHSSLQQANISSVHGQGLSLSLSTQIPVSSYQYSLATSDVSILSSHQSASVNVESCRDDFRNRLENSNLTSYAHSNFMSTIPDSKYLKAAQQLLDEIVSIQKTVNQKADKSQSFNTSVTTTCKDNDGSSKTDGIPQKTQEATASSSRVISPSERQNLQNKLTKLLDMQDEVDKRYKLYHHQMQILVSSFDAIAGCGTAKPYTSLALQTISQQFRNLRDAINGQIQSTRNSLGEQDSSSSKGGVITRLRYIDQHLRQQKAVQQLGMFQQHVWRPQRGLPETSVSILRAWLFEHFLHPYPTDVEKLMLARQTGLTRGQISNWFINARVRLWKPMIEDIYKEETGDIELGSKSLSDNAPRGRNEIESSKEREDLQSPIAEEHHMNQFNEIPKSSYISNTDSGVAAADIQNNATVTNVYANLKPIYQRPKENEEDFTIRLNALTHSQTSARFMAHQMVDTGSYGSSGVSLTLGLQHCNGGHPMPHNQQGFVTLAGEGIYRTGPPLVAEVTDYDCMNIVGQRNRFGPPHLLHDFVA